MKDKNKTKEQLIKELAVMRRLVARSEVLNKEFKLVMDALRKSEDRLAEAERVARFGSWEWDIEKNKMHCSDGLLQIFITSQSFNPLIRHYTKRSLLTLTNAWF
jgi:hypothetical protein